MNFLINYLLGEKFYIKTISSKHLDEIFEDSHFKNFEENSE